MVENDQSKYNQSGKFGIGHMSSSEIKDNAKVIGQNIEISNINFYNNDSSSQEEINKAEISQVDNTQLLLKQTKLLNFCCEEVKKPGSLLRIKEPWQMGKTTLISNILNHFEDSKVYQIVLLNFRLFDGENCNDLESFLKWFCYCVTEKLEIKQEVNERWNEFMGTSLLKCKLYFEKYLLAGDKPLILALDEVDKIFPHSNIAGQFLGLLRALHEEAKVNKNLQKLRVIFASWSALVPLAVLLKPEELL